MRNEVAVSISCHMNSLSLGWLWEMSKFVGKQPFIRFRFAFQRKIHSWISSHIMCWHSCGKSIMEPVNCFICTASNSDDHISLIHQYQNEHKLLDILHELTSHQVNISSNNRNYFESITFVWFTQIHYEHCESQLVCKHCADKLVDFYSFRQRILDAQQRLNAIQEESSRVKQECEIAFVSVDRGENGESAMGSPTATDQLLLVDRADDGRKSKRTRTKSVRHSLNDNDKTGDAGNIGKNVKKFICDQCNHAFRYPSRFIAHYRNVHLKQYERRNCPFCPRAFTLSSSCE